MKRILLCGLLLVIATVLLAGEPVQKSTWSITYSHAGLVGIKVDSKKIGSGYILTYSWHSGRKYDDEKHAPMRQTIESYDSHRHVIHLTTEEATAFRQWIVDHNISSLPKTYPLPKKETYGGAFKSELNVVIDDNEIFATWNGDSIVPEHLPKAIQALERMAKQIVSDRVAKVITSQPHE